MSKPGDRKVPGFLFPPFYGTLAVSILEKTFDTEEADQHPDKSGESLKQSMFLSGYLPARGKSAFIRLLSDLICVKYRS
jgi:hypothetical protein